MKIVVSPLVVAILGAAALHGCEPSRVYPVRVRGKAPPPDVRKCTRNYQNCPRNHLFLLSDGVKLRAGMLDLRGGNWGEGGKAKRCRQAPILHFGTAFVGVSIYVYKRTFSRLQALVCHSIAVGRGETPLCGFAPRRTASLAKFFIFFRIFSSPCLSKRNYLIINNKRTAQG